MVINIVFDDDFSTSFLQKSELYFDKNPPINLILSCVYPVLYVFMNMFQSYSLNSSPLLFPSL